MSFRTVRTRGLPPTPKQTSVRRSSDDAYCGPWSVEEDEELARMVAEGFSTERAAFHLRRTPSSVVTRKYHLRLGNIRRQPLTRMEARRRIKDHG